VTVSKPSHLELLAYHLYQTSFNRQGQFSVRWWCMDEKLKAEYLTKATEIYEKWATSEAEAMEANGGS